jgi:hypothetical protein
MAANPPPPGWGQGAPPSGWAPPPSGSSPPAWGPPGQTPQWQPGPGMAPHRPMNETMAHMARSGPLVGLIRLISFLLLFVGALLVMILATVGGGCVTTPTNCGTTWLSNAYTAAQLSRILILLGLSGFVLGSALRLQYGLQVQQGARMEDVRYIVGERWLNGFFVALLILAIVWITWTPLLFPTHP